MTFLFDENLPRNLSEALTVLGETTVHIRDLPELGRGSADVKWLQHAGEQGWCVVTRDWAILGNDVERAALSTHGVGAFMVAADVRQRCGIVRLVMRHWPEMKRLAHRTPRPFVMEIRENSVRPLRFRR